MNELIRQFAVQAGLIAPYGSDREGLADFDYRKFAELIVRECAGMVKIQNEQFMENEFHNGIVSADILEHFGIE